MLRQSAAPPISFYRLTCAFLYGSNRGLESFVVWAVQHDGTLQQIQFMKSQGVENRHILLDATGRWLIAANVRSSDVAVLPRDPKTGMLSGAAQQCEACPARALCSSAVARMFLRLLERSERVTATGEARAPCPVRQIDNFAMRNFTNDAVFDDTLPDRGRRCWKLVFVSRSTCCSSAWRTWFRRKGYLAADELLRIQEVPQGHAKLRECP